jgi:transposase
MQDIDIIQQGLGLHAPWKVTACDLNIDTGRLDIRIDFSPGSTFACPECGRKDCKAYDTKQISWRHLDFFEHRAFLNARTPRIDCPECGIHQVEVPWSRPECGFTHMFEGYVLMLAKSMPVDAIAKLTGEQGTRLWRTILHYTDRLLENMDYSNITRIGIDEITATGKGHHYITTFVDMDTFKPVFVVEGKDALAIKRFAEEMIRHGGHPAAIEDVSCDMSPAYISGIERYFPQARITFDKFHIVKGLNDAVDEIRRRERKEYPALKGTRYIWLKNSEEHTQEETEKLSEINEENPHLKTIEAYHMRMEFQQLWNKPSHEADGFLKKWHNRAVNSGMKPIEQFASTVEKHWKGILNWFKSHINNGILEGINSLINIAKFRARNFRSIRYLSAIVYLITGSADPTFTHTM